MVCAHNFTGDDEGVVGIMGLDRNGLSIISQTSSFFKNYFSYCLPAFFGSSTGYITFGKTNSFTNKVINFTPLTTDSETYDVEITGLSLGGHKLPIDSQVFKKAGGTVDSGTVISHLPPAAYAALKLAFRKKMSKYKMVKPSGFLDTCYDFSKYDTVTIPKMSIFFKGAVELKMDVTGIVIPFKDDLTEVCLAFSPNPTEDDGALIGNIQQQGMEVHYDVAGKRISLWMLDRRFLAEVEMSLHSGPINGPMPHVTKADPEQ
ncbi:aspartyl protease family protein At5g10770-like [Pistacia vera]|uniref:aspartyl protease family protein At5g10770-like n=1 Tax=Pistacia vera TaxID=55513 RepID=UPI00126362F6|nr:aspartyl protease family protein At5g10770-like [Pistacia vera]